MVRQYIPLSFQRAIHSSNTLRRSVSCVLRFSASTLAASAKVGRYSVRKFRVAAGWCNTDALVARRKSRYNAEISDEIEDALVIGYESGDVPPQMEARS